ncbi:MAG: CPBP family intramembrane metalloprotease [Candidatus Marinimicrobia bacterium]|nr:CPBP family intramembrane metalloprotease [Candidatus Neomarinimicrobiota bacterium]
MSSEQFERVEVYKSQPDETEEFQRFKFETQNESFRKSTFTWIVLTFLVILYPLASIAPGQDPTSMLDGLNDTTRLVLFISTMIIQWCLFLLVFGAVTREQTGLAGLGFKRIRPIDFGWAVAFLAASNLILTGVALLLAELGIPMPGEISLLIPQDTTGRIVWVFLSFTAGFCEETAFRGYLMTRLRLVGNFQNWVIPTIISAVVFGACHAYQGLPGFILISIYGAMFSLLYIRTGSIWPPVIAHFFQDFGALFFPQ